MAQNFTVFSFGTNLRPIIKVFVHMVQKTNKNESGKIIEISTLRLQVYFIAKIFNSYSLLSTVNYHVCLYNQVFDITRKITYKNLPVWYKELREFRPNIPCLCAANKIDGE